MRIDDQLIEFLSSSGPYERKVQQVRSVEQFRSDDAFRGLVDAGIKAEETGNSDTLTEAIENFLEGDTGFFSNYVEKWIEDAESDEYSLPPFREAIEADIGLFSNVVLYKKYGFNISLSCAFGTQLDIHRETSTRRRVQFSGQDIHLKLLSKGDVVVDLWECMEFSDSSQFNELECRYAKRITLQQGDMLHLDGRTTSASFAAAEGATLLLQVENMLNDVGSALIFDSATGRFEALHPTSRTSMRKMAMCSALRRMGQTAKIGPARDAMLQGPFYQRWHYWREAIALSTDQLPQLKAVQKDDASPIVRSMARRTLEILSQKAKS